MLRVAVVASSASLAGCAGLDVDANPFYVGRVGDAGASRVVSAGPLWEERREPGRRETALHPFWRRVATPVETRVSVLPPLYGGRFTADESSHRFLALSWARSRRAAGTEPEYDFMLFPLLWFGRGPRREENYFALFPLLGTIHDFATYAEAAFFLFPLYYRVKKDVTEPGTLHNVTPLIGWTAGGPRDASWRILPLFGRASWEGHHDKWTLLWPLFHYQRNRLDTDDPSRLLAAWPLFGIETSERLRFLAFLWPFFRFRRERVTRSDAAGMPYEEVYFREDVLWPLYRRERDREHEYLRLFPFYSRFESRELSSRAFAIPLVWKRETREPGFTKRTFDVVPLLHYEDKEWRAAERAPETALKLWPLFSHRSEAGTEEWKVPALLPLDVERVTGDFEAAWGPFFELWRSQRRADGSTEGHALFRLVDWEARAGRRRFSIPLLWSVDRTERRTRHDFLLGLIRCGDGEGGAELRVLGLPLLVPEPPRAAAAAWTAGSRR